MKILFFFIGIILCGVSFSQNTTYYNYRYFQAAGSDGISNLFLTAVPKDSGTGKRYPIVFETKGLGQNGMANWSYANMTSYGFARDIFVTGDNFRMIASGGDSTQIILVAMSLRGQDNDPNKFYPMVANAMQRYAAIVDTNRVYGVGWSMGSMMWMKWMTFDTLNLAMQNRINAFGILAPATTTAVIRDSIANKFKSYTRRGGVLFNIYGSTDGTAVTNASIFPYGVPPGVTKSAGYVFTTADGLGGSGHCCAAAVYAMNRTFSVLGPRSIKDWLALFSKKPYVAIPTPVIDLPAGVTGTSIWSNTIEFTDGLSGWQNSKTWEQISGPNLAIISNPADDVTYASGLIPGTYILRRRSSNLNGQEATGLLIINVNDALSKKYRINYKVGL